MTNWKEYKVEDICIKVTSGGTPNTRKDEYYGGNIPWVRTQEVNFNRLYETDIKITEEGLNNSSAKWIPKDSIIIAMYGATAGKVAINKIPVTTNQACCNLIVDEKEADYRFIYYNILSRFSSIANMAIGGAQQNLNAGMIKNLAIKLPNLPTQTAIAEILSSLDDKIELNNKINQELENLAQTLFKQWFIDFEFPANLVDPALSGDEGYKSSGGEMVDSELGEIPKGWEVALLSDLLTVKYGKDHKHLADGSFPLYGSGGIMRFVEKPLYSNESILIPRKGTLSNLFYVVEPFWSVDTMFYTIIHNPIFGKYLFLLIKGLNLASMNVGSAVPSMTTKVLNEIKIIKPSDKVIFGFDNQVSLFFEQLNHNISENQELTNLRDTLLPKLISGKLEVNEI
ncbi:MAG: type I restriction enzyme S subunit [Patiriisocius sp.]|jgi:type I restriction enzyme S subunit